MLFELAVIVGSSLARLTVGCLLEHAYEMGLEKQRLVLIGGGLTHLLALRRLEMSPLRERFVITLIDEAEVVVHDGLPLYLVNVASSTRVIFRRDKVKSVDPLNQVVEFESGERLSFDLLSFDFSLNSQQQSDLSLIDAAEEFGHDAYDEAEFAEKLSRFIQRVEHLEKPLRIFQVGAGIRGCEALLMTAHRLQNAFPNRAIRYHLLEKGPRVLPKAPDWTARQLVSRLREFQTHILLETRVRGLTPQGVRLESGLVLPSDFTSLAVSRLTPLSARAFRSGAHSKIVSIPHPHGNSMSLAREWLRKIEQASELHSPSGAQLERPTLQFIEDGVGGDFAYYGRWPLPHLRANSWWKQRNRRLIRQSLESFVRSRSSVGPEVAGSERL